MLWDVDDNNDKANFSCSLQILISMNFDMKKMVYFTAVHNIFDWRILQFESATLFGWLLNS